MKKLITILPLFILTALFFSAGGCGSDDPVDTQAEACSVTVTSPVAGASFRPGDDIHETVHIRWSSGGDASLVKIELLKADIVLGIIHPSVNNNGYYRWTANNMGAANGADFAIRVSALSEDNCLGVSGLFTLTNTVGCDFEFTNEFPDTLFAGELFNLTWNSTNSTGHVDIQLRKQDQSLGLIAVDIEDVGSYDWTVDSLHNGSYGYYFLRVIDSDLEDCFADSVTFAMVDEDVCFIDVINPADAAVWVEGTSQDIMISAAVGVTSVDLRLYIGSVFLGAIASDVPVANFPYTWNVDDFDNTEGMTPYRIMAVNNDDNYCLGRSGDFTIVPE